MRWTTMSGEATDRAVRPDVLVAGGLLLMLIVQVMVAWAPIARADVFVIDVVNDAVADSGDLVDVLGGITFLGGGVASTALLGASFAWLLWRGSRSGALTVAFAAVGALAADAGLKLLVGRARPIVDVPLATAYGTSFPSGHATNATITFGVLLLIVLPRLERHRWTRAGVATVVVVIGVGLSRVALGLHHPTDVVGGWSVGVMWLGLTNWIHVRWWQPPYHKHP